MNEWSGVGTGKTDGRRRLTN